MNRGRSALPLYKVELRDNGVTAYARHIFYDLLNNLTSYPAGPTSFMDALCHQGRRSIQDQDAQVFRRLRRPYEERRIFLIVIPAAQLDRITGNAAGVFRTSTAFFFITNDGLSIVENVGELDVKFPGFISSALTKLAMSRIPITLAKENRMGYINQRYHTCVCIRSSRDP
jgi:hypothetical protein